MGRPRKMHYKRSTPVARLRRNVGKMLKSAELALSRLTAWQSSADPILLAVLGLAKEAAAVTVKLDAQMEKLEASGFVPPKRSAAVVINPGDSVAVIAKYRPKYEEAFEKELRDDPGLLDSLSVVKIIPTSGEVVVRRGQRTPFIVRKSHLVPTEAE